MTVAVKVYLTLNGLALLLMLGTIDSVGLERQSGRNGVFRDWLKRWRLEPRVVDSATPVMASGILGLGPEGTASVPGRPEEREPVDPPRADEVPPVRGVYLSAWKAGDDAFVERLLTVMGQSGLNTLVVDIKDATGMVSYPSVVPLARTIGAGRQPRYQPERLLRRLAAHRIYPIARVVVFKDPLLAENRRDLAVKSSRGCLWRDRRGMCWVDPYNKAVWEYNVALAKEAANLGFKEIQFDYVRFTSDGATNDCRYPMADARAKWEVIRDFLAYAADELRGLGVKVSAAVFGLTCSATGDVGIGQIFEQIATQVDVICPMVYPSHYAKGTYQLANPDSKPYETVYRSLTDARRKIAGLSGRVATIRPWLQDFSLNSVYTRTQLEAQVKAVYEAGLTEWIFWNPNCNYEMEKYRFNVDF
jgi:hypothetical protein